MSWSPRRWPLVVSGFAKPGLALLHEHRTWRKRCEAGICDGDDAATSVQTVLWGGARFQFSDAVALTFRAGKAYISAGASFFF